MKSLRSLVLVTTSVLLAACQQAAPASPPKPAGPARLADLPKIDGADLLAHIKVLASDEYEGRMPGSKGEDLTVAYLQDRFQKLGLKPANPDGSFVQKVPLVGITADPNVELILRSGPRQLRLEYKDDFVAWTKHVADTAALTDSELVFVGYGVEAPEYDWDDFKGVDVKGKTLVVLINDPAVPDPADPSRLDPKTFGGVAMTYYGRWTYKYELAAKKGAAGVLIVHETGPAGYPYAVVQGNTGEQFDLVTPDKNMGRVAVEGWLALDQAKAVLALAGQDFDALKARAKTREFRPVPLGTTASIQIRNTLRTVDSRNVIARLEGSDPGLKDECVVYTAHWDHLGIDASGTGDRIYNGAHDNATGTAGLLELANAFTRLPVAPRRTVLFVAVTAEEQGLLGSRFYTFNPINPLARTLASINIDGMNTWGRTKDITIVGFGSSDLDDYAVEAAREQGRSVRPDPEPEKGFYYRSDHFNFAKQGVPALYTDDGWEYIGKPAEFGRQKRDEYTANDYHKPSDEVKGGWDLSGAVEDLQLLMAVGYRVAQADEYPEWKPGNEFRAVRERQLATSSSSSSSSSSQ